MIGRDVVDVDPVRLYPESSAPATWFLDECGGDVIDGLGSAEPLGYPWQIGQTPVPRKVRFRTVGCWPVTGAIQSDATTLAMVLAETLAASTSERQGRLIDRDEGGSLEHKKREGYF